MIRLDPSELFAAIAQDVPEELQGSLVVVGSLAAAYAFRTKLTGGAVNTKDADLVVHPAGNTDDCAAIASRLLEQGWERTKDCYPGTSDTATEALRVIRLHPPGSADYFLEFLGMPGPGQTEAKQWERVELADGAYGLPVFRYQGLGASEPLTSAEGLRYARPEAMALANALSHEEVGTARMSEPILGKRRLRSAKDLGRVLALARLSSPDELDRWAGEWLRRMQAAFGERWRAPAARVGNGLAALLANDDAMEDAWVTCDVGLLGGLAVSVEQLRAVGDQVQQLVIEPVRAAAAEDA